MSNIDMVWSFIITSLTTDEFYIPKVIWHIIFEYNNWTDIFYNIKGEQWYYSITNTWMLAVPKEAYSLYNPWATCWIYSKRNFVDYKLICDIVATCANHNIYVFSNSCWKWNDYFGEFCYHVDRKTKHINLLPRENCYKYNLCIFHLLNEDFGDIMQLIKFTIDRIIVISVGTYRHPPIKFIKNDQCTTCVVANQESNQKTCISTTSRDIKTIYINYN